MQKKWLLIISLVVILTLVTSRSQTAHSISTLSPQLTSGEIIGQLSGSAQAVAVEGNYAYVGFETELAIIDITDKAMPIELGRLEIGELVRKIAKSGDYAYLATNTGLQIVGVADPINPQWVGIYEQELVTQVQIRGEYAFILSRFGLDILSVSEFPDLILVGQYEADIVTPLDLDLMGDYVFLLSGYPNDHVIVVNVSNIEHPIEETLFDKYRFRRIDVANSRFLTVNNACSSICITFFDVWGIDYETWTLSHIGTHAVFPSWWSYGLISNQFYAYVGKDIGLFVYNFYRQAGDGSPLQIDYFDIGDVRDIVAFDDYVYAVSVDREDYVHPPLEGGFFILPAPPLFDTYLPLIARNE